MIIGYDDRVYYEIEDVGWLSRLRWRLTHLSCCLLIWIRLFGIIGLVVCCVCMGIVLVVCCVCMGIVLVVGKIWERHIGHEALSPRVWICLNIHWEQKWCPHNRVEVWLIPSIACDSRHIEHSRCIVFFCLIELRWCL